MLRNLPRYSVLDLSFNLLKTIPDTLHHLSSLRTVYFVQNRISRISGLQGVGATLRSLELGGNKLRVNLVTTSSNERFLRYAKLSKLRILML
jgi:protein phosphatase 1 regulatory subunit 7